MIDKVFDEMIDEVSYLKIATVVKTKFVNPQDEYKWFPLNFGKSFSIDK